MIAGGSHVTLLAREIAADARYGGDVEFFLPGAGEVVLVSMLRALRAGRTPHIPSVVRPGAGSPVRIGVAPAEFALPPEFDERELALYPPELVTLPLKFGHGCPYGRCTMCTYVAVEPHQLVDVRRAAEQQLASLAPLGIRRLSIKDSLFDVRSLEAFATAVGAASSGWTWSATTKVAPCMIRTRMAHLYACGCRTLELGVETIHPALQQILDKRLPLPMVERVLEATLDAGIAVVINLIYGLPGESEAEAQRQLDWFGAWARRYPEMVYGSHNLLGINRGSRMARNPEAYGLTLGEPGPWGSAFPWRAPAWRARFASELQRTLDGREPRGPGDLGRGLRVQHGLAA